MTEKVEENGQSMDFLSDRKKILSDQTTAFFKGWIIVAAVWLLDYLFVSTRGLIGIIIAIVIFIVIFLLVLYFIWAPQDVCWGCSIREGYTKALVFSGGKLYKFLMGRKGKAYDEEYNVVDVKDDKAKYKDKSLLGLHINPLWPFTRVYMEDTEWKRYYPNLKKALPRKEVLRQFSLVPYPYYIDVLNAEDKNRTGIDLLTTVIMEIQNPERALFKETTQWINIVTPLIQGGYVSFIKQHTINEMLGKEDLGMLILKEMPNPNPITPSNEHGLPGDNLAEMILKVYGVKIVNISIIDFAGADKEMQKAMNAKAKAQLNREAKLIDADAEAQSRAIETMDLIVYMLARTLGKTKDQVCAELQDDPKKFIEKYGTQYNDCLDMVRREMAIKGRSFYDLRTPDASGKEMGNLLNILLAAKLVATGGGGPAPSGDKKEEKKGKIFDEKTREALKKAGVPVELEDEM